jgi:signal transduction histidine kinase/CheY-like chemotaxis protein
MKIRNMKRLLRLLDEALGIDLVDQMEMVERVRHVRAASTIGMLAGFVFGVANVFSPSRFWLGIAELLCIVLFFLPAFVLVGRPKWVLLAERILMFGAMTISSALIIFGSAEGSGLFWVSSVPFMAFFILGQRRGWYYSLGVFACHALCLMVLGPNLDFAYQYSPEIRTRFLMAMVYYLLIAATFNHARSRFETALHLRKNEAEAANLAKSRFLASASHDLRQPAHALGLFVARLKQLPQDMQARELVANVDASVHALQDMLDAFFDYSRLDSQLTHANPRSFDLGTIFDKLRISFADTAQLKGLRLRVRSTRVWVHSDPVLLHRVLLNLVSNAVQHTPSGTVLLTCRASRQSGYVRIQVRDSGIGIAQEHQAKVFEEFYQVENPERDRNKGLGLGLSIVERSCNLLSHRIGLRSALGCGSTFTLHVPLGHPQDVDTAILLQEAAVRDMEGMRVMLIEDDELGRDALQGLLQSWGCNVVVASAADEAMDRWNPHQVPDFIVTDYRLRGQLNGVNAVSRLRERAGDMVAACVISGDTDLLVKQEVADAGLLLLQKPVKPAKLRSVLRHAWSVRQGHSSGFTPLQ